MGCYDCGELCGMPTAAVIRAYLEEHGIQAALNAAVNAALQVQAPNALEFIGDWLIKKAAESGGAPASTVSDATKDKAAAIIQNAAATTGVSEEKLAAAALIQNAAAGSNSQAEKDAAAALIQTAAANTGVSADKIAAAAKTLRPDFALLILEPPQQKLELSETNKYSWAGATEEQERALYRATWRLFQGGLGEALCGVLREKSHPHLLPYIGGNVPLNYYLKHNFKAPAPIASNDIDIKVEFGDHMRALLAERGGGPSSADKESWGEEEKAQFQACFDESLAMFVTYAKELMDAFKAAAEALSEQIRSELKPLGVDIGPQGVHVYHKTHAAPRGDKPPLHLVPLSGGVFQLMCEVTPPAGADGAEPFIWNLVDLEADWKSAQVDGKAFPTVTVPLTLTLIPALAQAHSPSPSPSPNPCPNPNPSPNQVPSDAPDTERGLRLLAPDELRKDLEGKYQEVKEQRRAYKREYWDWAKAHADESAPPAWVQALPADCGWA